MGEGKLGVTIGIGNQKGGVGKSTTTVHLAAALGERGYRCLVIDLDPSAGATKHLGIPPNSFAGTLELLTTSETPDRLAVSEKLPKNVELIPARSALAELDRLLSKFEDRTRILERPLALARQAYDFVLLDTPPNAGCTTTVAAYSAAEWFLLSVFPHPLALGGLNEALKDIADVRARRNSALEILGVIVVAYDARTTLGRDVTRVIQVELPGRAFATEVSQAIEVAKAAGLGKTLFQMRVGNTHRAAQQYRAIAEEIEWRVLHRDDFVAGRRGHSAGEHASASAPNRAVDGALPA